MSTSRRLVQTCKRQERRARHQRARKTTPPKLLQVSVSFCTGTWAQGVGLAQRWAHSVHPEKMTPVDIFGCQHAFPFHI